MAQRTWTRNPGFERSGIPKGLTSQIKAGTIQIGPRPEAGEGPFSRLNPDPWGRKGNSPLCEEVGKLWGIKVTGPRKNNGRLSLCRPPSSLLPAPRNVETYISRHSQRDPWVSGSASPGSLRSPQRGIGGIPKGRETPYPTCSFYLCQRRASTGRFAPALETPLGAKASILAPWNIFLQSDQSDVYSGGVPPTFPPISLKLCWENWR